MHLQHGTGSKTVRVMIIIMIAIMMIVIITSVISITVVVEATPRLSMFHIQRQPYDNIFALCSKQH